MKYLKPFLKFFGKIGLPKRKFTGKEYFLYRDKINVGCILLTKTYYEFSNLINPCELKHGAIYVGNILDDEIKYVLEATGKGVVLTDLVTFLTGKDIVVCVEYKNSLKSSYKNLRGFVNLTLNTPYDYLFEQGGKAFYCFELCAEFIRYTFNPMLKIRHALPHKDIYDHNTFLDDKLFTVIFEFKGK